MSTLPFVVKYRMSISLYGLHERVRELDIIYDFPAFEVNSIFYLAIESVEGELRNLNGRHGYPQKLLVMMFGFVSPGTLNVEQTMVYQQALAILHDLFSLIYAEITHNIEISNPTIRLRLGALVGECLILEVGSGVNLSV